MYVGMYVVYGGGVYVTGLDSFLTCFALSIHSASVLHMYFHATGMAPKAVVTLNRVYSRTPLIRTP